MVGLKDATGRPKVLPEVYAIRGGAVSHLAFAVAVGCSEYRSKARRVAKAYRRAARAFGRKVWHAVASSQYWVSTDSGYAASTY
jgi:hypothetical protein